MWDQSDAFENLKQDSCQVVVGKTGLELRGYMSHSKESVNKKERKEGGGGRCAERRRRWGEGESHDLWKTRIQTLRRGRGLKFWWLPAPSRSGYTFFPVLGFCGGSVIIGTSPLYIWASQSRFLFFAILRILNFSDLVNHWSACMSTQPGILFLLDFPCSTQHLRPHWISYFSHKALPEQPSTTGLSSPEAASLMDVWAWGAEELRGGDRPI